MSLTIIEELECMLAASQTLNDCDKALVSYLKTRGIKTFSFTYYAYHPSSKNKLKYDICSDNFSLWHQHYLSEQYNYIDSTLNFVYQNHLPIYWDLKQQLKAAKNETERKMRQDSIDFGATSGLSIPIHGPNNNFATLVLVQMKGEKLGLNQAILQYELYLAAHHYYHYIQPHLLSHLSKEKQYSLTEREIQCLLLIAKGFSVKAMAQNLELSERTINFHIQKLNKKLGTRNKYQSLAKALELDMLTL